MIIISMALFACTFGAFLFYHLIHNESFGLGTEFFPEVIEVLFGIIRYFMFLGRYILWGILTLLTLAHLNAIVNSSGDQQRLMLNVACILLNAASAYFCYWAYLENVRS